MHEKAKQYESSLTCLNRVLRLNALPAALLQPIACLKYKLKVASLRPATRVKFVPALLFFTLSFYAPADTFTTWELHGKSNFLLHFTLYDKPVDPAGCPQAPVMYLIAAYGHENCKREGMFCRINKDNNDKVVIYSHTAKQAESKISYRLLEVAKYFAYKD